MVSKDDDLIFTIDVSSLLVKLAVVTIKGKPVATAQQPYTILTDDDAGFVNNYQMTLLRRKRTCSRSSRKIKRSSSPYSISDIFFPHKPKF